jgi:hypothetical protein
MFKIRLVATIKAKKAFYPLTIDQIPRFQIKIKFLQYLSVPERQGLYFYMQHWLIVDMFIPFKLTLNKF